MFVRNSGLLELHFKTLRIQFCEERFSVMYKYTSIYRLLKIWHITITSSDIFSPLNFQILFEVNNNCFMSIYHMSSRTVRHAKIYIPRKHISIFACVIRWNHNWNINVGCLIIFDSWSVMRKFDIIFWCGMVWVCAVLGLPLVRIP